LEACDANGLLKEPGGQKECRTTINSAINKCVNDRLDQLADRPRENSTRRANGTAKCDDAPATEPPKDGRTPDLALTETAVARMFEQRQAGQLLHEHRRGIWYCCDRNGGIWRADETRSTQRSVQLLCEELRQPSFQTLKKIKAVEEIANASAAPSCSG
jgi:hypothetical protein